MTEVSVYASNFPSPRAGTAVQYGRLLFGEFVRSVKNVFDVASANPSHVHFWEVDPEHLGPGGIDEWNAANPNSFYLLLRAKPQSWSPGDSPGEWGMDDPNDQQVLIEGINITRDNPPNNEMCWITYAPKGGIDRNNFTTQFAPGISGVS
jgi:hypothetical protein